MRGSGISGSSGGGWRRGTARAVLGGAVIAALVVQGCGSSTKKAAVTTSTTARTGSEIGPGAELWAARYNGPANRAESAFPTSNQTVAVSPDGTKVFVTGTSEGTDTGNDYVTLAYDASTGKQLWQARYTGPGNGDDIAAAVTVSPDGAKLFVTGGSTGATTGFDTATVAYNTSTGSQLWVARYDGPAHKNDGGGSIAVDGSGAKVFVTGTSEGAAEMEKTYATVAYDASNGSQLWAQRYSTPTNRASAGSLALAPNGSMVYVTGWTEVTSGSKAFGTVAYTASTGAVAWTANYGSDGDDEGRAVAVSPDGAKLFVVGASSQQAGPGYTTVAYNAATGGQLWTQTSTSPPRTGQTYNSTIVVTPDGAKVVVAGVGGTAAYSTTDGKQLWTQAGTATALAVTRNGDKIATTGTTETPRAAAAAKSDYAVAVYETATGKPLWTATYNGPANGDDSSNSVAATQDKVLVTGVSEGTGSGADLATVAYAS